MLTALAAVRAGKDVYLEKPMGLNLTEDWALRKEVHRHKRVFQFGTQQRSSRIFRLACALVRNGCIGKLQHINVWSPASAPGGSTRVVPVPPGLDYELWLGPAPARPHTQDLVAGPGAKKTWWYIRDLAVGFIAGWGIHPMDIAVWGGGDLLSGPVEVDGRGTFHAEGICDTATAWNVNMKFGSGVTLRFEGTPNHPNPEAPSCDLWEHEQEWKKRYRRITDHGTAFEGTEGWVHVDRGGINLQPENLIDAERGRLQSPAHPQPRPHPQLPRLRQEPRGNRLPDRRVGPFRLALPPQRNRPAPQPQARLGPAERALPRRRRGQPAPAEPQDARGRGTV